MKTPVTITMLVIGGFLILAPFAFGALHDHEVAALFGERSDIHHFVFNDRVSALGPVSRFGCWFTGTGLCVVAILGAVADARRFSQELSRVTPPN